MLEGYKKLPNGVVLQEDRNITMNYDEDYITNAYSDENMLNISYLRLGFLLSYLHSKDINSKDKSILDVGYGFGHFLKVCNQHGFNPFGLDINGHDISKFAGKGNLDNAYDVITFFDSLEHFEDINFVKDLQCETLMISVPWCHYFSDDWFESWKHRKYGEHLWHFNDESLEAFLNECGYEVEFKSNVEDIIRKNDHYYYNILTIVAKRRQ